MYLSQHIVVCQQIKSIYSVIFEYYIIEGVVNN